MLKNRRQVECDVFNSMRAIIEARMITSREWKEIIKGVKWRRMMKEARLGGLLEMIRYMKWRHEIKREK